MPSDVESRGLTASSDSSDSNAPHYDYPWRRPSASATATATGRRASDDLPPWKTPHGSRRPSWRSASKPFPKQEPFPDSLKSSSPPFSFQKRTARIDWRTLHSIDVDQIVRETDINKLEGVLDTIAFGDVQGEDTRNFTETNFIKLFRLSQLMVEYLLHMQELLVSHKSHLLEAGSILYKRAEKFRLRCIWQHEALWQSRRELKRTKKTLHTYESLLHVQGHVLPLASGSLQPKQAHYCPFCEKIFESAAYLEMHISRRHPTSKGHPSETKSSVLLSKSKEPPSFQVKQETTSALETEIQRLHAGSQVNNQRVEGVNSGQVASLQTTIKENNDKLKDVQRQLENLQRIVQNPKPSKKESGDKMEERKAVAAQEKLRELEVKFGDFEQQIKQLGQENAQLLKELNAAYSEVSGLKSEKRRFISSMDQHDEQVEELQQEIQELRKSIKKDYPQPCVEKRPKEIKKWLSEAEDYEDRRSWDGSSRLAAAKRLRHEDSQLAPSTLRPQILKTQDAPCSEPVEDPGGRRTSMTADVLTDAEKIAPEKEKWLRLHPYAPLANSPYALAMYPHSPTLFASKHNEVSRHLNRLLKEELKKFGIPSHAEGISDAKYAVVAAALEKQQAFRLSTAPLNEKKVMEYERSTVLWQIERAVHSRDMSILESIFDEGTESASGDEDNVDGPESEKDEIIQTPSGDQSQRRSYDLDFEGDFNGRRSLSRQESDHSDAYGRSREHSQLSEVPSITKNPLTSNSLDDLGTHTFQVVGRMATQRLPSLSDEHQQQHKIVISAVSSPTAKMPGYSFEHPEGDAGLGDWESDGEVSSRFAHSSPRRSTKDEQHDGASASSKNTGNP